MMTNTRNLLCGAVILVSTVALGQNARTPSGEAGYTGDGRLMFPEQYREWVYLTSGFDMSYSPAVNGGHHLFDNLFVNPKAYSAFMSAGTWPDHTVLVLELRRASAKDSINKQGDYQGSDVVGVEVHVKDNARFAGKWGFFSFEGKGPAKMIPHSAACYSCHATHGAVDTTFVQYYPTLLSIARSKGTLSASYREETAATAKQ